MKELKTGKPVTLPTLSQREATLLQQQKVYALLGCLSALFLFLHFILLKISSHLSDLNPLQAAYLFLFLYLEILAGFLYLLLPAFFSHIACPPKAVLLLGIGIGLALRGAMFFSTPIQETDYYRYLWDGAVTAHAMNPFRYSPAAIQKVATQKILPGKMQILKKDARHILGLINHPRLRTIYPLTAQVLFAAAYVLNPFSINGLRIIYLGIDFIVLGLLLQILKLLSRRPYWALLYWCNPLLLKEIYNSGHMDILLFPCLLSAILFAFKKNTVLSLLFLALSTGVKGWPVILFPLFVAYLYPTRSGKAKGSLLFIGLVSLLFLPMIISGWDPHAGWVAYSKEWEMNDALFLILLTGSSKIYNLLQISFMSPSTLARLFVAGILTFTAFLLSYRSTPSREAFLKKTLVLTALLFLFSPAQFPWYFLWLLPLLSLQPNFALLSLTPLLTLYALRPIFLRVGEVRAFDYGIVWIEFLPPLLLLLLSYLNQRYSQITFLRGPTVRHA